MEIELRIKKCIKNLTSPLQCRNCDIIKIWEELKSLMEIYAAMGNTGVYYQYETREFFFDDILEYMESKSNDK